MLQMQNQSCVKGFTLVELIVVIAIIGILAALLVPTILGFVRKARRVADLSTAHAIYTDIQGVLINDENALESYNKIMSGSAKNEGWYAYVKDDSEETYNLVEVMRIRGGHTYSRNDNNGNYDFNGSQAETKNFAKYVNEFLDLQNGNKSNKKVAYPMKLELRNMGYGYCDEWSVCMNLNTKDLEIWAADSTMRYDTRHKVGENNHELKGQICYRLYPAPDECYK